MFTHIKGRVLVHKLQDFLREPLIKLARAIVDLNLLLKAKLSVNP